MYKPLSCSLVPFLHHLAIHSKFLQIIYINSTERRNQYHACRSSSINYQSMADHGTSIPWPTEPWEAAKARFLEGLPEDQKTILENSSLEDLFYQAGAGAKGYEADSKLWSMQRKLAPFIDAVEDYSKAMDVFANSSTILCPLWGSVRILLHVSHIDLIPSALIFLLISRLDCSAFWAVLLPASGYVRSYWRQPPPLPGVSAAFFRA
jgi:hypothetical protein